MNKPANTSSQKGWSLVETSVVLACLALMGIGAVSVLNGLNEKQAVRDTAELLARASSSLSGTVLTDTAHLPAPSEAGPSPARAGYVEGWLPTSDLELPSSRRIRYLVDESLTTRSPIYRPDPLGIAGPGIETRTTPNGIDFCAVLMARELAGAGLPGGMRAAFAIQVVDNPAATGSAPRQMWLADGVSGTPPPNVALHTMALGYSELAEVLGCRQKMARIASGVKSAALHSDLLQIATREETYQAIGVTSTENGILSLEWGTDNFIVALSRYVGVEINLLVKTHLANVPMVVAELATIDAAVVGVVALYAYLLDQLTPLLDGAKKALPGAKQALAAATAERVRIEEMRQAAVVQVNQNQKAGLSQ